ncbi:MAG: hydroxyacid dehydrogenase [Cyanophyceae cyanobacterium]
MKIVVFEIDDWEHQFFEKLRAENEVFCLQEALSSENASQWADADIISPFIYSELSRDVLAELRPKLIATRSTGFDHIAIDYCQEQRITVCNVPTYGEHTVAEHAFGLLLAISHNIVQGANRAREGEFTFKGLQGFDLRGKTLGVIGTGNIGQCMVEIAKGFRLEVVAFDPKPREELAAELGFRYAEMNELLSASDIVTLHVPANDKTHHLLSSEQFEQMKDGAILINTSRGSVIDIQALVHALAEGKVAAAGLDVLQEELVMRDEKELLRFIDRQQSNPRLLAEQVLLRLKNVVITPHSAFNTREARERIIKTTIDNITAFLHGEPQNAVNEK